MKTTNPFKQLSHLQRQMVLLIPAVLGRFDIYS